MSSRQPIMHCPHCGGTKSTTVRLIPHGVGNHRFFIVKCLVSLGGCDASCTGKTKRQAVENWNRRFEV